MNHYERVRAEIDLDAFANNIKEIKRNVGDNVAVMSVVKADGYGHGSYETAVTALESGAQSLGVAILEEAVFLREKGITAPITIVGASFIPQHKYLVEYDIEQTVFNLETAKDLNETAKKMNKKAKVLIKVDTGMGRLGFLPCDESVSQVLEIFEMENIHVTGIFSHLSCADHEDKSYSIMQHKRFEGFIGRLKEKGINLPPLHISNSGAIIGLKDMRYDVVRAGIMQYGFYPSELDCNKAFNIKPVMSIKAGISFVKTIKKGESVGYNAYFKAPKDTVVATVPVGYADGYSRKMRNNGRVIINGQYAPVIGSVCMDQFMVDVTEIKDVKIGDTAVLLGKQGDKEITAYEIARICETITYEVVCAVSKRVPRVYFKNGKCLE